jgi:hypothetical protein
MHAAAVRRLLVMRADGSLAGVLSMDDVLDAFALEIEALAGALHSGTAREASRLGKPQGKPLRKPTYVASQPAYLPGHEP